MITGFSPSSSSPMILLLWSLLLLLVYYVLKYIKQFAGWVLKVRRIAKALQHFPGPPKHWLYGNLHLVRHIYNAIIILLVNRAYKQAYIFVHLKLYFLCSLWFQMDSSTSLQQVKLLRIYPIMLIMFCFFK